MPRQRLFNMEIDEVSLVDRAANQHSTVAIAKRDSGENMPQFEDSEGNPVDENDINAGDYLYDSETGDEYYIAGEDELQSMVDAGELDENFEPVGKAAYGEMASGALRGMRGHAGAARSEAGQKGVEFGAGVRRNKKALAIGGATVGAGGVGVGRLSKRDDSLGQYVMEELSKAHADERVTGVVGQIAKAYDEARAENKELRGAVESLIAKADHDAFTEVAKSFELPYAPTELGGLLQRLSYAGVDDDDLETLGQILGQAGQMSKAFEEIGADGGYSAGSVLGEVSSYAQGLIGKSDGMSYEGAMTEVFSANPEAYDQYLLEQG